MEAIIIGTALFVAYKLFIASPPPESIPDIIADDIKAVEKDLQKNAAEIGLVDHLVLNEVDAQIETKAAKASAVAWGDRLEKEFSEQQKLLQGGSGEPPIKIAEKILASDFEAIEATRTGVQDTAKHSTNATADRIGSAVQLPIDAVSAGVNTISDAITGKHTKPSAKKKVCLVRNPLNGRCLTYIYI